MVIDNICKYLAEKYPQDFALWLLGEELPNVEVLKTELGIEPIRADAVTFLRGTNRVLHLEFQTEIASEPPLPLRMLDYWVRLYRKYNLPITQILILLKEISAEIQTAFRLERTRHEYEVVKMWEQNPAPLLENEHLLALATLAKAEDKTVLLQTVARQIKQINNKERRANLLTEAHLLAGLRYKEDLINLLLKESFMQESVTYQAILQKGKREGKREGKKEGKKEGEMNLILRLLEKRFGKIGKVVKTKIDNLTLAELDSLGLALLDFSSLEDLQNWLKQHERTAS